MDKPGRIFVGGLSRSHVESSALEEVFAKFGKITEVSISREKRGKPHQSRGYAFIVYENPEDGEEAIKHMDNKEFEGNMIHVDHASKSSNGMRGGGSYRSRGGMSSSYRGRGGGGRGGSMSRGRGGPRSDRGGRGRGRDFDRPRRDSYDDDRRGPPSSKPFGQRRDSFDRGFSGRDSRGPPSRRDDDRDRFGGMDRDRFSSAPERRSRDPYPPSPPRSSMIDSRNGSSYRDYAPQSRDYSPPPRDMGRDRAPVRDYGSSRDLAPPPSRSSYGASGRDSFTSGRDSYAPRDDYRDPPSSTRDYQSSRDPVGRDYGPPSRDSGSRGMSRDFDRGMDRGLDRAPPSRDYDSYRDSGRPSGPPGRSFSAGSPRDGPMSRSSAPPSRSSYGGPSSGSRGPPVGMDRDRDRGRMDSYSTGTRRPAPFESRGSSPKRSRLDMPSRDGPMRSGPPRDGPIRSGPPRDGPMRGPPRDGPPRDGPARGGPPPFRR